MANAGASNGGYGPNKPSPYWNAQSEPKIDMWDPSEATNYANSSQSDPNDQIQWQDAPSPTYQPTAGLYGQSDMNSNWRSQMNPPQVSFYDPNAPPDAFPQSSGYSGQSVNPIPNSYGSYNLPQSFTPPMQRYDMAHPRASSQPYSTDRNFSGYSSQSQAGDWRTPPHAQNPSVGMYQQRNTQSGDSFYNVSSFKNPLMDSESKDVDDAASLVRNMQIQGQKAQQEMQSNVNNPRVLSKASLAMLKQDLEKAAVAFQSPEALKRAREKELGFHAVDDIGVTVVVSSLSAEAPNFVPRFSSKIQELTLASKEEEEIVVESLKLLIENVLTRPGDFDDLATVFINRVRNHSHGDETVNAMVEMICEKAMNEDNFKYLGARLCDKLTMPKILVNFRSNFLKYFQNEFKTIRSLLEKNEEKDTEKIHGFLMFMAEIFIHIKIDGSPIKALGRSLSKSLEKLLGNPTSKNVSFVCKLLKLSGAKLCDAFENNDVDMTNYQKTFTILQEFSEKQQGKTDEETKRLTMLISSVSRLKDSNWGRTVSNTRKKSSIADPEQYGEDLSEVDQYYYMNEPVFFTPEGVQYTAAEAQIPDFYDQHLAKYQTGEEAGDSTAFLWSNNDAGVDDFIPSDDEEEYYRQDSEDTEYNAEFEKFLTESGQI